MGGVKGYGGYIGILGKGHLVMGPKNSRPQGISKVKIQIWPLQKGHDYVDGKDYEDDDGDEETVAGGRLPQQIGAKKRRKLQIKNRFANI